MEQNIKVRMQIDTELKKSNKQSVLEALNPVFYKENYKDYDYLNEDFNEDEVVDLEFLYCSIGHTVVNFKTSALWLDSLSGIGYNMTIELPDQREDPQGFRDALANLSRYYDVENVALNETSIKFNKLKKR